MTTRTRIYIKVYAPHSEQPVTRGHMLAPDVATVVHAICDKLIANHLNPGYTDITKPCVTISCRGHRVVVYNPTPIARTTRVIDSALEELSFYPAETS